MTIGAGTKLSDIVASTAIKEAYPALWQATVEVGSPQIRNMATVGGNLLQRPRCWYFRAGHGLLGMKDGKSLVRSGDNRYHAIFLTDGDALFVTPSSLAVALSALDAQATITGPKGNRTVKVEALYQVPKTENDSELTIGPGEILTKVTIPPAKGKNASYEARQKQAQDWPLVLASVNLAMDGDNVSAAKVVRLRRRADPLAERRGREGDHRQACDDRDGRRRRRGRRGRRGPTFHERLQGPPDQDRGQAGPARGYRQPLLGGGLIGPSSRGHHRSQRLSGRRIASVSLPASAQRGNVCLQR